MTIKPENMTPEQRRKLLRDEAPAAPSTKHRDEMTEAELVKFEKWLGVRPSHSQLALRRRNLRAAQF